MGEILCREPCTLGYGAVFHGGHGQDRSQHMPVEAEIIVDGGVGRVTTGQQTIGRDSDTPALLRQVGHRQRL